MKWVDKEDFVELSKAVKLQQELNGKLTNTILLAILNKLIEIGKTLDNQ